MATQFDTGISEVLKLSPILKLGDEVQFPVVRVTMNMSGYRLQP